MDGLTDKLDPAAFDIDILKVSQRELNVRITHICFEHQLFIMETNKHKTLRIWPEYNLTINTSISMGQCAEEHLEANELFTPV